MSEPHHQVGKKAGSQSVSDLAPFGIALPGVLVSSKQVRRLALKSHRSAVRLVGPPPHYPGFFIWPLQRRSKVSPVPGSTVGDRHRALGETYPGGCGMNQ
jgi:hypothetical protein